MEKTNKIFLTKFYEQKTDYKSKISREILKEKNIESKKLIQLLI